MEVHARERRAASSETRETRAASREKKRIILFSCLSRLAPSDHARGHLRVLRVLLDGPKRERLLYTGIIYYLVIYSYSERLCMRIDRQ